MLCAGLHYEADGVLPLHRLLPPLLVVRVEQIGKEPLLAHTLDGLRREIMAHHEGRSLILLRGFELVCLLGLRVALRDADSLGRVASASAIPASDTRSPKSTKTTPTRGRSNRSRKAPACRGLRSRRRSSS